MRMVKWNAFLSGLCGFVVALGVIATSARADVVTEKPASILVFPKVITTGGIDTVIQISNTTNNMVHARCFYVDARLPEWCGGIENPLTGCLPIWNETDFTIWLTKQQPTHWRVTTGRPMDPTDTYIPGADGAGIDPGAIPPVPGGFVGELRCVEVMIDGAPVGGNSLKGEAILKGADGDVSKYNAIGIIGSALVGASGNDLLLNRKRDGSNPGEYNACPAALLLNHFGDGGAITVAGTALGVTTELTLVPCSANFETQQGGRVTVQFAVYNEYEEKFSASITVNCWKNIVLTDIDSPNNPANSVFSAATLGTDVAHTRITPADPTDGTFNGAVVGVAEVTWVDGGNSARAALNIHTEGDRITDTDGGAWDHMVLPDLF
ncbi:MAG: hypothetical protein HY699_15555 [Deltaproteobacteria bacterium]|nr:hypothetical protein [Deltaproteobacteria bacterium]